MPRFIYIDSLKATTCLCQGRYRINCFCSAEYPLVIHGLMLIQAIMYAEQALELAQKLNYERGIAFITGSDEQCINNLR